MDSFLDDLYSALQMQMQSETMDDLRPLYERLGRTIVKFASLAIARNVVSSEYPFRNLSDDILQHILARLPAFPLMAAKKVCKRWASVTTTPEFDILHKKLIRKPRLVPCGINYMDLSESQWFAYDVENNKWLTLPALQLPAHNYGSLAGIGNGGHTPCF